MKLHRLHLRNFRGIADRDCEFAQRGVTVVSGRNEAGKSSMVEALDLLLEVPSASRSRRTQAVQPAGRDVGTEIEAEISCGAWYFTYTKVFNKGQSTTLRIHEPKPEQLTGKAAHERVLTILDDAVDLALLRASRVVQGAAATTVAMSESTSVTRALDRAVADPDQVGGDTDDNDLLAVVEAESARYFTAGRGQPTGELLAAQRAEKAARLLLADLDGALAAIDADVETVARLTRRRAQLHTLGEQLAVELEEAEQRRRVADDLRDRLTVADATAEAVRLRQEKRVGEREARRAMAVKIVELVEAASAAADGRLAADEAMATAVAEGEALERGRAAAESALADLRGQLSAAEAREEVTRQRSAAAAAIQRLQRAEQAHEELAQREAVLAANTVDAAVLAQARKLRDALVEVTAQLGAVATTMRVLRLGDQPVLVNGGAVGATGELVPVVGETVVVEVPGAVRVELCPARNATELAGRRDECERGAAGLCAAHAAADLDALIALGEQRMVLVPGVAAARTEVDRVCAGAGLAELRQAVSALGEVPPAGPDTTGEPGVRTLRDAEHHSAAQYVAAERAVAAHGRRCADLAASAGRAADSLARAERDLGLLVAAQEQARAVVPDVQLDVDVAAGAQELVTAESAARGLRAALDEADLAEVERRVTVLDERLAVVTAERAQGDRAVAQALARIDLCREDARRDRRDEAASAHSAAQAELDRVMARARAAQQLRTVLTRHRATAHARYSEPFRRRIEELAAPLFGSDVRFEVDDDLGIAARTLEGATVPFGDLSMGAREQIGIIARLACAMLVDEAHAVPVIIDDALGHSDSDRVAQMGQVLTRAGECSQVIVLTCAPERYLSVAAAAQVAL